MTVGPNKFILLLHVCGTLLGRGNTKMSETWSLGGPKVVGESEIQIIIHDTIRAVTVDLIVLVGPEDLKMDI